MPQQVCNGATVPCMMGMAAQYCVRLAGQPRQHLGPAGRQHHGFRATCEQPAVTGEPCSPAARNGRSPDLDASASVIGAMFDA